MTFLEKKHDRKDIDAQTQPTSPRSQSGKNVKAFCMLGQEIEKSDCTPNQRLNEMAMDRFTSESLPPNRQNVKALYLLRQAIDAQ